MEACDRLVWTYLWISLSLPSLLNFSMYSLLYRSCVWHCSSNIFIVSLKASMAVLFIWISWKQDKSLATLCKYSSRNTWLRSGENSPVMFWCTPRTAGRTLCFSPGTAGGTRRASSQQLRCCLLSPPGPEEKHSQKVAGEWEKCAGSTLVKAHHVAVSPAGVWRLGTATSRPVWGCTAPATRCDSGWWAPRRSWRSVGLRTRTSHPDGIS